MVKKRNPKKENKPSLWEKLIILGVLLFLLGTLSHTQIFINSLISQKEHPRKEYAAQSPASISIPSIKLETKVIEGGIVNGNWILSDTDALFLPTSGKIGEGFNTIVYAHNTDKLFGSLRNIKQDDLVILRDRTGKEFKYKVFSIENVDPQDLRKLYSTEKNIISLFTCDGWFDQSRLLVKAKLVATKISPTLSPTSPSTSRIKK